MRNTVEFRWVAMFIACVALASLGRPGGAADRPNVLVLLVDDLKPALGCYGDSTAKTPHIDRLAARGTRFDLAYCNQAVCAPSRFTLMLGSHSTSTGLYGLGSQLRQRVPDAVTLPQYFAKHGYRTESLGKVFHIGHGNQGDPLSFSVEHFHDKVIEYVDPASTDGGQLTREEAYFTNQRLGQIQSLPRGAAFESPNVPDEAYADGRVADETVRRLLAARERREREGTPFFIVAGFARPHLPFSAPKKYWDLYDPAELPLPAIDVPPIEAPAVADKKNGELANYKPVPDSGNVDGELRRQLIHGYYASVSFVDAQIGKVLNELNRQQLADDTIVVLWGDHGFHLGDHNYWTKHTNYEQANRIPLIVAAPGVTKANTSTRQLAESVDVFPTLAELAGLPAPTGPQRIDGKSLVPVLRDPDERVRDHAYHVFPKAKLGRAIRTERYRLVEWRNVGELAESAELELYDYETDAHEVCNIAAAHPQVVEQLRARLAEYPEPVNPNSKPNPQKRQNRAIAEPVQNVLLIISDDLRASVLGCYGDSMCQTPNIDRLAARSVLFERAYCQGTVCAPSRASLMRGRYVGEGGVTLGEHFIEQGYHSARVGKIFHMRVPGDIIAGTNGEDIAACWSERHNAPGLEAHTPGDYACLNLNIFTTELQGRQSTGDPHRPFVTVSYEGDGSDQPDWKAATKSIELLQELPLQQKPFLLATGFVRPHYPMVAPRKYFAPYPPTKIELPEMPIDDLDDIPPLGISGSNSKKNGLARYPENQQRMWAGYYASVTFMDEQVGRLLAELDRQNLTDKTVVVFTSDHGYHLGDHTFWQKSNLHEQVTRVPLIISAPGIQPGRSRSIVQLVDLFPTLCELTGVSVPESVEGKSLVPVLRDPSVTVHEAALSYVSGRHYSLRTDRWAYMRYADGSEELYDMSADPMQFDNLAKNVAHTTTLESLRQQLQQRVKASAVGDRKKNKE